jgi:hypothetical protein
MSAQLRKPRYVKYRSEKDHGLVYDHENYGYEDATLTAVSDVVIDVLERVNGESVPRESLERQFSVRTIETMIDQGYLTDA